MRGRGPLCCVPTPRGIMDILSVDMWALVQRARLYWRSPFAQTLCMISQVLEWGYGLAVVGRISCENGAPPALPSAHARRADSHHVFGICAEMLRQAL